MLVIANVIFALTTVILNPHSGKKNAFWNIHSVSLLMPYFIAEIEILARIIRQLFMAKYRRV